MNWGRGGEQKWAQCSLTLCGCLPGMVTKETIMFHTIQIMALLLFKILSSFLTWLHCKFSITICCPAREKAFWNAPATSTAISLCLNILNWDVCFYTTISQANSGCYSIRHCTVGERYLQTSNRGCQAYCFPWNEVSFLLQFSSWSLSTLVLWPIKSSLTTKSTVL